jgi:multiple sugar transport system ATP-binding protein
MTMGDRVAVMKKGELQQVGSPPTLFGKPHSLFVAGFIGSPSMNFVSSKLERANGDLKVAMGDQVLDLDRKILSDRPALEKHLGKEIILGVRPQDFEDASLVGAAPTGSRIKAHVDLVENLGTQTLVHFAINAPVVLTEDMKELAADVGGEQVEKLAEQAEAGQNEFVAELDPKSKAAQGDNVELYVDTTQLHFFDPETSLGIY